MLEPDLPIGTRCMVDVAAMERDGPEPPECDCSNDKRVQGWTTMLRLLAEQTVVVALRREVILGCCKKPDTASHDDVSVDAYTGRFLTKGFSLRRKYVVPLPEGEGRDA